ncbi:MAG: 2-deoxy-5-keto-D-gluconate 6-phosphate aldolase domain-containing protein [Actinomycetota bacterium]
MPLGYEGELYILAFDHRGSFQKKLMGIEGSPSAAEAERITDAKQVIFEGFLRALEEGAPRDAAGILVDEQYGEGVARRARNEGLILAMPVEKSGQDEFDFEYGEEFGKHIEEFDPGFTKVLVRFNAHGDTEMNARQLIRLRELSEWLHERDRKFLFELLVPAEPEQLEKVGGDEERYDREVRPALMLEAIESLQAGGVEPDVWKIEGLDAREDCLRISALVRSNSRDRIACVVLGRGADESAVDHWLKQGAGVPGYVGFAIGRTIWWDPLKGYLDGSVSRDAAAGRISQKYRRFIEVYRAG